MNLMFANNLDLWPLTSKLNKFHPLSGQVRLIKIYWMFWFLSYSQVIYMTAHYDFENQKDSSVHEQHVC